jgi:hypothetical protein
MKPRSRAYNRDVSKRKALRKKRISDNFWPHASDYPYYDNLHQYSKNKIQCSCPLCSQKTKNKGKRARKNYNPTHNYKASDLRKKVAMDLQEEEINE